jgi:outer membrane protein TolC
MISALHKGERHSTPPSAARRRQHRFAAAPLFLYLLAAISTLGKVAVAQQPSPTPMRLTLDRAIDLALKQNHSVRLRSLSVEQMQSKKDEAKSSYLPHIKTSAVVSHVTELEGIEIPPGTFGNYPSTGPVPAKRLIIDQGSATSYLGGVGLEQPLTQLFRIHEANIAAREDVLIARTELDQTQDSISLQVRQMYYKILVDDQKLRASEAQLDAANVKGEESHSDVERGNALEVSALQSQASILQAQQENLALRLEGEDLRRQLADTLGLPINTPMDLDPAVAPLSIPTQAEAIRIALSQNRDVRVARQTLVKARAGLTAAKDAYIPDITALSHYHYESGVPFLVHNFGTFGFSLNYDLVDGGRREAVVRGARIDVTSAEVAIAKLQADIEVQIHAIYDRIDELRQMVDVAGQVVTVRTEAARLADRQFEQNAALNSARSQAHADLVTATASLIEAQFGLSLAEADLKRAIGQRP